MSDKLIVCVPGLRYSMERWAPLLKLLRSEPKLKDADILTWNHGCRYFSTQYPQVLSQTLAAEINGKYEYARRQGKNYDAIILLGHSLGGVLVRQAYLIGLGSDVKGFKAQEWASKVRRIVLFAGLNRGLFPPEEDQGEYPYKFQRWLGRHLIEFASQLSPIHLMGEDLLAGSTFITNMRLWWMRKIPSLPTPPTVVQLVGTKDGLVRASDSLDIEQDLNGNQIAIPEADHATVIDVEDENGQIMPERSALILKAIIDEFPQTPNPIPPAQQKDTVIFVVHGIRASNGEWVQQASERVQAALPKAEVVPATYWYFSALDFLLPLARRRRVRWFQDTYAYFMARNPEADFRFLGHSNGTYLLGESLRQLSGMRFSKVVLAGSVLPRDFDWRARLDNQQIVEVWNHRALLDVPVAVLCNALRGLFMKDVGTGGYDGFSAIPAVHECHFHPGGHGAAVEKEHLIALTDQVTGASSAVVCCPLQQSSKSWFDRLSRVAHLLPYVLFVLLVYVSHLLAGPISAHFSMNLWVTTALAFIGLSSVLAVFLKFY